MRLIDAEWLSNAIHNFFSGKISATREEDIQAYINATPTVCDIEFIKDRISKNISICTDDSFDAGTNYGLRLAIHIIEKFTKGAEE